MLPTVSRTGRLLFYPSSVLRRIKISQTLVKPSHIFACSVHGDSNQKRSILAAPASASKMENAPYLENLINRGLYIEDLVKNVKNATVKDLKILEDGQKVEIKWEDDHVSRFDAIWLRHSCHCPDCRLDHNGMLKIDFRQVDEEIRVTSASVEGNKVVVFKWESPAGEGTHEGPVPAHWLRHYCYSKEADQERRARRAMKFHEDKTIPEIEFEDVMNTDTGLYRWLTELSERGICLIKNTPKVPGMVGKVAERIAPIQHTIYGETFDVISTPQPINAAYSSVKLDLHMDQIHYESPPGLQLLHCVEFDPCIIGGDNTFCDIHEIAHKFREEKPDLFDTLARVPILQQTVHYNRPVPVHVQFERPLFTVNHKNELVAVTWHPMLLGPLQVPEEEVKPFYKAFKYFFAMVKDYPSLYKVRMVAGDLISFNNRRVLHGREAFVNQQSKRFLQGTYVEITEFQSQVQVYHNLKGDGKLAMRPGNYSYQ